MPEQPVAVGPAHLDVTGSDIARPISACRHLLEAARAQGVDPAVCLQGTGLSIGAIHAGLGKVRAGQELALVRNVIDEVADRRACAQAAGMQYTVANMGVLGLTILASPTIADAVDAACRYAALSSTFLRLTRREEAGGVQIRFHNDHLPADVRTFLLEREMYALINMAPLLVSQLTVNALVRMELPGTGIRLERLQGLRIEMVVDSSASRTVLHIPGELLEQPMPAADAATAAECVRQCDELMNARRRRRGLAGSVRERLCRDPADLPSMALIAAELCMSERTLHRRLADENTGYRQLADEVRANVAAALLSSDLTVEEAGRRLGYAEVAAFSRAFVRWTGELPSAYRRRMHGRS